VAQLFRRSGVALVVLLILALYAWEAHGRRAAEPLPLNRADQAAYLNYARRMHETHYAVAGDRNRMPVFPFLLSLIYRPGMSDGEFLARAQAFNVNLSILLLGLLFLIFRRFFASLFSVALLVATAFGVFVYRAGSVQVEPLFYFLSFCAFIFLLRMLIAPRWWLAVLAGATTAVAYLTKASMLPTIAIWAALFIAQTFWRCRIGGGDRLREAGRRFVNLLLVIGAFAAVVWPYERTSKKLYGHYFFNVNSAYYMWCDSWPEALAFTDAWRRGQVAPDQAPSPAKYWREHSLGQVAQRLLHGMNTLVTRTAKATGYYKFSALLVITAAVLILRQPKRAGRLIGEKSFAAGFGSLVLFAYVILYAWYDVVVTDSRFIVSLFLPFMFVASVLVLSLGKDRTFAIAGRRWPFAQLLAGVLICFALIDVAYNALRVCRLIS
jgi:hypothetical protein